MLFRSRVPFSHDSWPTTGPCQHSAARSIPSSTGPHTAPVGSSSNPPHQREYGDPPAYILLPTRVLAPDHGSPACELGLGALVDHRDALPPQAHLLGAFSASRASFRARPPPAETLGRRGGGLPPWRCNGSPPWGGCGRPIRPLGFLPLPEFEFGPGSMTGPRRLDRRLNRPGR